jgi:hypothetical protein
MHQVQFQITDQLYTEAKRRADVGGFKSVDDFVAEVIVDELSDDPENFYHLFTPERIAHLDRIAADMDAGGVTYTPDEVTNHLEARRADWIRTHGR